MNNRLLMTLFLVLVLTLYYVDGKKISRGRSSSSRSSSSSRKSYNPAPTSLSNPQSAASKPAPAKPSLFNWQEKPAQRTQTSSRQSKPSDTQSHSYPSSHTGLSGSGKQSNHQENIQRSNAAGQQSPPRTAVQPNSGHSYPASTGLSGNSGSGTGYPQSGGLSGAATGGINTHAQGAPPAYSNANSYPKQGSGYSGGNAGAPPPYSSGNYAGNNHGGGYHHPQGPPPPYGGHGGYHGSYNPVHTPQSPGYFGNYGSNRGFGGMSRSGSALTGVGIAGAGVGTLLTGLALWNLARSTGRTHHTVIYDNRGQPVAVAPDNSSEPVVDPILGDLVNCTLTISGENSTEVLAIPCAIATSFTPEADVKNPDVNNKQNDNTKCTVTVVTKAGREFLTTISCSILLNTAAENNVTEPLIPPLETNNSTIISPDTPVIPNEPFGLKSSESINPTNSPCIPEDGEIRDPINPCFAVTQNLTVVPLPTTFQLPSETTPGSA